MNAWRLPLHINKALLAAQAVFQSLISYSPSSPLRRPPTRTRQSTGFTQVWRDIRLDTACWEFSLYSSDCNGGVSGAFSNRVYSGNAACVSETDSPKAAVTVKRHFLRSDLAHFLNPPMASSYIKHHKQCWGELDNYTQWREVRGKTDANGWREGDNRRPSSNVTGRIQEKSSWYVPRSSRNQEAANGTVTIFPNRRMSKPLTDSMASSFSNTMVSSLKLCERNCTSSSSTESERNSPSRSYRRSNSLQGSGGWLPVEDERWAGPSFSNSPPPSSLPLPRFTFALKNASPCHDNLAPLDRGAPHSVHSLFSEAKWTWDVAFATKDLKRLLHLDYSSSQGWDN